MLYYKIFRQDLCRSNDTTALVFFFFFDLPICGNEQVIIVTPQNVQFEDVRFFKEVSDEEKFLLFQYGKINSK